MRGGPRKGAGRKKSGKHIINLWVTRDEENLVRKYLNSIRKKKLFKGESLKLLENEGQTTIFEFIG